MAVNFSSTAVLIVSHRFDTNSLMDSHISDVLLLTFSQAVLMDVLIALNNVLARDLSQFQRVFKSVLIPFQMVLVAPDIAVHARLTNILNECYCTRNELFQCLPNTGEYFLDSFPGKTPVTSKHTNNEVNYTAKRCEQSFYDTRNGFPETKECINGGL